MTEQMMKAKLTKLSLQEEMRFQVKKMTEMTKQVKAEDYQNGRDSAAQDWKVLKRFWQEMIVCYRMTDNFKDPSSIEKEENKSNISPFPWSKTKKEGGFVSEDMLALRNQDLAWLLLSPSIIAWLMKMQGKSILEATNAFEGLTTENVLIGGPCSSLVEALLADLRIKKSKGLNIWIYNWACEILQHNMVYSFLWEDRFDICLERESRGNPDLRSTLEERLGTMCALANTIYQWQEAGIKDFMLGYISGSFKKLKELMPEWRAQLLSYCELSANILQNVEWEKVFAQIREPEVKDVNIKFE